MKTMTMTIRQPLPATPKTVKSLAGGSIKIDTKKFVRFCRAITYCGLYVAKKLVAIAAGIMLLIVPLAGGDGKYYDGDIKLMLYCAVMGVVCLVIYRFLDIITSKEIQRIEKRRTMRKAS